MNKIVILFIYSLLINSYVDRWYNPNNIGIKRIVIHYVNQSIETIYDVPCSDFEQYFGKRNYKEKVIIEQSQLREFAQNLSSYQKGSQKSIDVRAKIYIYIIQTSQGQ